MNSRQCQENQMRVICHLLIHTCGKQFENVCAWRVITRVKGGWCLSWTSHSPWMISALCVSGRNVKTKKWENGYKTNKSMKLSHHRAEQGYFHIEYYQNNYAPFQKFQSIVPATYHWSVFQLKAAGAGSPIYLINLLDHIIGSHFIMI